MDGLIRDIDVDLDVHEDEPELVAGPWEPHALEPGRVTGHANAKALSLCEVRPIVVGPDGLAGLIAYHSTGWWVWAVGPGTVSMHAVRARDDAVSLVEAELVRRGWKLL